MVSRLLDADEIKRYVAELAAELGDGPRQDLIVVGGALLAWYGLRDSTRDVDSAVRFNSKFKIAVERVAQRHDLAPDWLNDSAAAFHPATLREQDCAVLFNVPQLRVLGPPMDQVFLMKLFASRAADTEDLERMWPHCCFESPEAAAEAFYVAYPAEKYDEHLADHIRSVVS